MRRAAGYVFVALALPVLCLLLSSLAVSLSTDILAFLLVVVAASLIGGLGPALVAAVGGFLLLNYYFTPPFHSLAVARSENLVALGVFVIVGVAVSAVVDRAERRRRQAAALVALLSAAGHDLRTPLASAVAAVEGLDLASLSAADRTELLDTAAVSLDRLGDVVEDLLDLSRLRVGGLPVVLEATSVAEVVAAAVREVGAEVVVHVPDDVPDVTADPALLQRAVVNLVSNALRHSPAGVPPAVSAETSGRRVLLRVTDHGPGVPADRWDRLFVPFQPSSSGVGLGLALTRGLVEAMSGRLTPSATPGGGLTMTITLLNGRS